MKKLLVVFMALAILTGCDSSQAGKDIGSTIAASERMMEAQPTPQDVNYSIERFNLIKRSYWVNGERERALSLVPQVKLPLGYIVLFSANSVVSQFTVEGKVTSLNSFLTPSMFREGVSYAKSNEIPDIDGSYGENDNGIFFFTVDGKYVEWTGDYLYSDLPLFIENPTVTVGN